MQQQQGSRAAGLGSLQVQLPQAWWKQAPRTSKTGRSYRGRTIGLPIRSRCACRRCLEGLARFSSSVDRFPLRDYKPRWHARSRIISVTDIFTIGNCCAASNENARRSTEWKTSVSPRSINFFPCDGAWCPAAHVGRHRAR